MYHNRIFTLPTLIRNLEKLGRSIPDLLDVIVSPRIDGALREKLLLTVTAVNQCRYCAFVHSQAAQLEGVEQGEVRRLMERDISQEPEETRLALEYADHFARTGGNPEQHWTASIIEAYGVTTATQVIALLRAIHVSNLSGNTFDAFISRLRGDAAADSSAPFEGLFAAVAAPILLPVLGAIKLWCSNSNPGCLPN